ncbi:MAG: ATP-binding protein [Coleofasciculaceae cyanobacterium]
MISNNTSYCHLSLEYNEQQNIADLKEELVQAQQKISRQALLNKIIQVMQGTLVLDEILQTTVNQLQGALQVSHCLIFRPDANSQMVVRYVSELTHNAANFIGQRCVFCDNYHSSLLVGESVVLSRIDHTLPPAVFQEAQNHHCRAIMIVPLIYQKSYIGGITLMQCEEAITESSPQASPEHSATTSLEESSQGDSCQLISKSNAPLTEDSFWGWTAANLEIVQAIADHCAIAIYQAELHQKLQIELAERKQVEEALRQSEARYRAIVEDQTELICRFKPNGILTFVNDAYCRYFNKQRCELIGQEFLPTMPSQDRELISKNFRSLSPGHPINTYEHRIILPSGEIRWQQWSDRAVFDDQGNFIECQAVGRDITQLKQAEFDIRMALEKEREVSELRSSFVALVSHEFRTPLTIIQSSTDLLENYNHKLSDEKKYKLFGRVQGAVRRMTNLLEDVLLIGKAEAGKLNFQPSLMNLLAFCRDIVENLQMSISSRHAIDFFMHGNCGDVIMDEKLLGHILTNLLSNAIKYSPQGGIVKFDVICSPETTCFLIQDHGIGIPKPDLEKLFESFRRASNVGSIPGTGLGLAIIKKCVDLHGGQIDIESEIGVGTTFTVTLPCHGKILRQPTSEED